MKKAHSSREWIRRSFTTVKGREFQVSIGIIHGAKPGPTLAHVGGQHGMEHMGPIILRDFFDELDPEIVCGTVYVCPCANPLALELDEEVYPEFEDDLSSFRQTIKQREDLGQYNMNRLWPDWDSKGVAGQIVQWIWQTMIVPADVVIDHHAVKAAHKPYIFVEKPSIPWTPFLGVEAVWSTGPVPVDPTQYVYRRLGMAAQLAGKIGICIEYSVQRGVKEPERENGRWGLYNLMKAMRMIEGEPEIRKPVWLLAADGGPYWGEGMAELNSAFLGHPHYSVEEYQPLKKGQLIAEIRSLETNEALEQVTAPDDCLMLDRKPSAVCRPGERLCRVHTNARILAKPGGYAVPDAAFKSQYLSLP